MQATNGSITEYHDGYTIENKLFTYSSDEVEENRLAKETAQIVLKPAFIPVNPELLQNGFSPIEALVYGFLQFFLQNNDRFYCTNDQLATMLGVSEKTISLAITELKKNSMIELTYKTRMSGGKTRFIRIPAGQMPKLQKVMSDITKCKVPDITKSNDIKNNIENNKIKENNKESDTEDKKENKKGYGEFKRCMLSDTEYQKVVNDYGLKNAELLINKVDNYCSSKGKAYKNYVAAIRNFAENAGIKKIATNKNQNSGADNGVNSGVYENARENDIYLQNLIKCKQKTQIDES